MPSNYFCPGCAYTSKLAKTESHIRTVYEHQQNALKGGCGRKPCQDCPRSLGGRHGLLDQPAYQQSELAINVFKQKAKPEAQLEEHYVPEDRGRAKSRSRSRSPGRLAEDTALRERVVFYEKAKTEAEAQARRDRARSAQIIENLEHQIDDLKQQLAEVVQGGSTTHEQEHLKLNAVAEQEFNSLRVELIESNKRVAQKVAELSNVLNLLETCRQEKAQAQADWSALLAQSSRYEAELRAKDREIGQLLTSNRELEEVDRLRAELGRAREAARESRQEEKTRFENMQREALVFRKKTVELEAINRELGVRLHQAETNHTKTAGEIAMQAAARKQALDKMVLELKELEEELSKEKEERQRVNVKLENVDQGTSKRITATKRKLKATEKLLEKKNNLLEDLAICPICMDNPKTHFYVRCGHGMCGTCIDSPNLKTCPDCRCPEKSDRCACGNFFNPVDTKCRKCNKTREIWSNWSCATYQHINTAASPTTPFPSNKCYGCEEEFVPFECTPKTRLRVFGMDLDRSTIEGTQKSAREIVPLE